MISFRHDESQSPFLRPLMVAGLGFGVLALFAAGLALFGDIRGVEVGSRQALDRLEESHQAAADPHATPDPHGAVEFHEDTSHEPTLPGVHDIDTPPPDHSTPVSHGAARAVPYAGLFEPGPGGPLPKIAPDGQRPSEAYAHPFTAEPNRPVVGIIIGGLGLNRAFTEAAINELPPEVTLSFVPYVNNLQSWIDQARAAGHEVVLELPMEPFDYPNNDPGPHTLRAGAPTAENIQRLDWLLSRAAGYFGVTNYLGARLTSDVEALSGIYTELERRGLNVLHDGSGRQANLTRAGERAHAMLAVADRVLDSNPSPQAIDQRLLELEALALQNGQAYGSGFAYPATVQAVKSWIHGLELGGYQLAPVSYIVTMRHPDRASHDGETGHGDDSHDTPHGEAPAAQNHGDDHH
ncbi:divergent polysaccharide deacetylase family protein [Woodsholea maritima]|uniref:divergent polysaccharide deacetylase family protein n=1 Tax=Woodsholea maritima TaxID=240237 RepID=UPI00036798B1|nr:divergent polysaccharide deacetylase family protein [Woodsholea maritima]